MNDSICFNCHIHRALVEIFSLLFSGYNAGISLLSHGIKEKGEGILMKIFIPLMCALQGNVLTSVFSAAANAL